MLIGGKVIVVYGLIAVFKGHRLLPDFMRSGSIYRCIKPCTAGTHTCPGPPAIGDNIKGLETNPEFTGQTVLLDP